MNAIAPLLAWLRRRLRTEERGFTLVELMVAQGVILVSLLSLAYTATIGFSDIALARQRQSANGLLNRTMEQVRALPFDAIKRGLYCQDSTVGSDSAITGGGSCNATWTYRSTPSATPESIPHGTNSPATLEPLSTHRTGVVIGGTTYTRYVYVTYYNNDTTLNAFRVTVVVQWTPPQRRGVDERVQGQSILYSPPGCRSTATHPFAAPCQPFIYGEAQLPQGSISIVPTPATGFDGVRGMDLERVVLFTPGQTVSGQAEQITSATARPVTSGVELKRRNLTASRLGFGVVSAAADNDPTQSSGTSQYVNATTFAPPGSGNPLTLADDDLLAVQWGGNDVLSSGSTMTANSSTACGSQLDELPCTRGTSRQGALSRAWVEINQGGVDLENAYLATLTPPGTTDSVALVHRDLPANLDGSMGAQVTRVLSTVALGSLPTDMSGPAGWNNDIGMVRVSGYTATLEAQAGESSTMHPLSATVTAGTLQYWNGTGYTTVDLRTSVSGANPVSFNLTFDHTVTIDGKPVRVIMSGSFLSGGVSTSFSGTSTNRTAASARALPALIGNLTFRMLIGPVTEAEQDQADLTMIVDLGTNIASGTYSPAPGAGA